MSTTKDQAHSGTDQAANAAKQGVDAGARTAHGLVESVTDMAEQGRRAVSGFAEDAGKAASEAGHKAQRWAEDAYDSTSDKVKEYSDEFTSLIRKHPVPALLVSFAVGILTAKALRS